MAPVDDGTTLGVAGLIMELQSVGLRLETRLETARQGGAGPSDSGMPWIEGVPVTVPPSESSPYSLRAEDDGQGIYRDGIKLASVSGTARPRFYELTTPDGIPYHQIALLHLDSLASTVVQACNYWGNSDQCGFCGIGLSLAAGRTIAKKTPEMLAEVAVAAPCGPTGGTPGAARCCRSAGARSERTVDAAMNAPT